MNEINYLIQFDYNGQSYNIATLSHCDFSKGNAGDKLWIIVQIEDYIKSTGIHSDGANVSNIRLFGKGGELIVHINNPQEEFGR